MWTDYRDSPLEKHYFVVGKLQPVWANECGLHMLEGDHLRNCRRPGFTVEFLYMLSEILHFNFTFIRVKTWSDIEAYVESGQANFSLNFLAANTKLNLKYKHLSPMNFFYSGFAVRNIGSAGLVHSYPFPPVMPFLPSTWGLLILAFVVSTLYLALVKERRPCHGSALKYLLLNLRLYLRQDLGRNNYMIRDQISPRKILLVASMIPLVFLYCLYSSRILGGMLSVKLQFQFRSTSTLASLLLEHEVYLFNNQQAYYQKAIEVAAKTNQKFKAMLHALEKNPILIIDKHLSVVEYLYKHPEAALPETSIGMSYGNLETEKYLKVPCIATPHVYIAPSLVKFSYNKPHIYSGKAS